MMDPSAALAAAAAALPPFLLAYWVLATGAVLVTVSPLPVPQAFKCEHETGWQDAVRLSAARGKLWQDKPKALGPLADAAVPQAWFLHFYLVGCAANAAVLLAYGSTCCVFTAGTPPQQQAGEAEALAALALFQLHLVRRAAETALLMRYPPDAKMHAIAYLFGLSYYLVVPLSLVPAEWYQRQSAGGAPAAAITSAGSLRQQLAALPAQLLGTAPLAHAAGTALFLGANALQLASHWALAALGQGRGRGGSAYKIPKGPLFDRVSCPHYLAECLLYLGLALLTRGRAIVLLIAAWVVVNLVLAARATHAWYLGHFKTYPRTRRALVPWLL